MFINLYFYFLPVISLIIYLPQQTCGTSISPLIFDAYHLIPIFKNDPQIINKLKIKTLDPVESFKVLKFLSFCNLSRSALTNIINNVLCPKKYDYYVKIKNVHLIYGRFVHSTHMKYITDIQMLCKYHIVDSFYEIISCYDKDYLFGPYFFGFEIGRICEKCKSNNQNNSSDYMHTGNSYDGSDENSKSYIFYGDEKEDASESPNYYCKLKILVNSYLTTDEEHLLKIMSGLCMALGYEKQFFITDNLFPIMKYYEQPDFNKLTLLGYNLISSRFYESKKVYSIKGYNAFINTHKERLVNNIIPTLHLQFTTKESYLLWKGIAGNPGLFNEKLLELRNLLNRTNFKERIKLCYQSNLSHYYEDDELHLTKKPQNKLRSGYFRYNKQVEKNEKKTEKLEENGENEEEREEEKDVFINYFDNLCGDENTTSFEECVYKILISSTLDEKTKSILHQFMYDGMLCLETCHNTESLNILNNALVIQKLKSYIDNIKVNILKSRKFAKEIEGKLKRKNNNLNIYKIEKNEKEFFPDDENIKTDFFENTMFFFEYYDISPLLRDEKNTLRRHNDMEKKICNISKFLKGYGKLYLRNNNRYQRTLDEYYDLNTILNNDLDTGGYDNIFKKVYDVANLQNLNLDINDVKENLKHLYSLGTNLNIQEGNEEEIVDEDAENYFFDSEEGEDIDDDNKDEVGKIFHKNTKMESNLEEEKNENENEEEVEIDSLSMGHKNIFSMIPLLLKMNNILKRKNKSNDSSSSSLQNSQNFLKQHASLVNVGNKKVSTLANSYEYETLEHIFLDKKNVKIEADRTKDIFTFINNYYSYGFYVENVPSKRRNDSKQENANDISKGNEANEKEDVEEKGTLHFLCSIDGTWPFSKKKISFYWNSSIHCEAQYENELKINMNMNEKEKENEKEEIFNYLMKELSQKEGNKMHKGSAEEKRDHEENAGKEDFFLVDKIYYPHKQLLINSDTATNKKKKKNDQDKNEKVIKSKLIGFSLLHNTCAVKYIGNKNFNINNPFLSNILLKVVFGFCLLHGFTVLKIESETMNSEIEIKNKFLEILTNGKTQYEHLGFQLLNLAIFPKENYYVTNGFLPNTKRNLFSYLKFEKNFYVEHNINSEFFNYMNKKTMETLHNLAFRCDEDYESYSKCYEMYPLVKKSRDYMCLFEKSKIFKELNKLFPGECRMGEKIRNCYKQIKKNIPCFQKSEGCKYYDFIIYTFIVPHKNQFFIDHRKSVNEYLSKQAYSYYLSLVKTIKNDELRYAKEIENIYNSSKNKEEGEENEENENEEEEQEEGEENDKKKKESDESPENEIISYLQDENDEIQTEAEAYHLLNYLMQNSTFFIFWNFSTEYWKRFRYIHAASNSNNGISFYANDPVKFCPVAYAYEFIYHFNTYYVMK